MAALFSLLTWDRVLGALIGGGLAWCVLAVLNQAIWLPQAREDERNKLAAEALQKTIVSATNTPPFNGAIWA